MQASTNVEKRFPSASAVIPSGQRVAIWLSQWLWTTRGPPPVIWWTCVVRRNWQSASPMSRTTTATLYFTLISNTNYCKVIIILLNQLHNLLFTRASSLAAVTAYRFSHSLWRNMAHFTCIRIIVSTEGFIFQKVSTHVLHMIHEHRSEHEVTVFTPIELLNPCLQRKG